MKFVVVLIILAVTGLLVYQRTAGITITLMDDCHTQAKQQMKLNDSSIRTVCPNNKSALEQMSVCLETVQKEKFLAGLLYGPSGVNDKVRITVLSHNQLCPDHEMPIPTAELYIN